MDRTPEQIRAIETTGKNLCVDAGAGSGKTSVLVGRVLHILENRLAPLEQIVAITFTEKAAAEMKERLRREFHRRAPADDPDMMNFWRGLERRAESARFTTIHSFCAGLLRENALSLGSDPDFAVLADAESFLLREEVVEGTLHILLEAQDEDAVRVAAEYGLRKVREMLHRLLKKRALMEKIGREHPLHDAIALAAHWRGLIQLELKRRRLAMPASRRLKRFLKLLGAFDGQCANPREGRETLRRDMMASISRILADGDTAMIDKELGFLAHAKARGSKKDWPSDDRYDSVKALQDEIIKFAAENLGPELDENTEQSAAEMTCSLHRVYLAVAKAFQDAKAALPAMDFDDLILAASAMLRDDAHVRARTARGIRFLLIDEFQDTDERQFDIAHALRDEPGGPELFIVGDAKQSIYRFRGAEVGVFVGARKDSDETIPLARNFRSLPNILEFANDFFVQSGMLDAVEPTYHPLQAHRESVEERRVEFLLPDTDSDSSVDSRRVKEAQLIADRLVQMCNGPQRVTVQDPKTGDERSAHFGDATLLFRSLSSVYLYEQALRERGIPYTVVAGTGFYERQEVLDIRNLLSLVADPWDEMALLALLRSPMAGLSDDAVAQACEGQRLATAFYNSTHHASSELGPAWARARELLNTLRANRERPLPDFVRFLLDQTGYEAVALSQFLGQQKARNVRKVLELADDFARTRAGNLAAFVHYLDEIAAQSEIREGEAGVQNEASGAVTLMTVHKSKGLEFPIVIIPDMARTAPNRTSLTHSQLGIATGVTGPDGETDNPAIYDLIHASDLEQEAAESGRVLYVAMTRARDWLVMSGAADPKRTTQSWLDALNDVYGLYDCKDGQELSGADWRAVVRRSIPEAKMAASAETPERTPSRELLIARTAPAPLGPCRRSTFSVSEILDAISGQHDAEDNSNEPEFDDFGRAEGAMRRGSLIHRMFELWDFTGSPAPDVDALLRRERTAPTSRNEWMRALEEAASGFVGSALWKRVTADGNASRELPFLFRVDDALLNGTMDLVLGDGTIVDYKTGRPRPELHSRYEQQLRLYAAARQQITGQPAPSAFLYYVDERRAEEVDVSPERVSLALNDARAAIARLRAALG